MCRGSFGPLRSWRSSRDEAVGQNLTTGRSPVAKRVPEVTYLPWLDFRALVRSCRLGNSFWITPGAGLNFRESFGADYAGFARLNIAMPAAISRGIFTRIGRGCGGVRQRDAVVAKPGQDRPTRTFLSRPTHGRTSASATIAERKPAVPTRRHPVFRIVPLAVAQHPHDGR
jgi:hypothetical protein